MDKGSVRIHAAGKIVVRGLPPAQINRFEPGVRHLHRLVAGQRAERIDIRLAVQQALKLFGHLFRDRVLDLHRVPRERFLGGVIAGHAAPARIAAPLIFKVLDFFNRAVHGSNVKNSSSVSLAMSWSKE